MAGSRSLCEKSDSGGLMVTPGFIDMHSRAVLSEDNGHHRQLTDIYLLGLASTHSGRLATFDRTIPVKAVVGATARTPAVIEPAG